MQLQRQQRYLGAWQLLLQLLFCPTYCANMAVFWNQAYSKLYEQLSGMQS